MLYTIKSIKYPTANAINPTNKNPQKPNSLDSCNSWFPQNHPQISTDLHKLIFVVFWRKENHPGSLGTFGVYCGWGA